MADLVRGWGGRIVSYPQLGEISPPAERTFGHGRGVHEALIAELARRQDGAVASWQLRQVPTSRRAVAALASRYGWRRPWDGVLIAPGPPTAWRTQASAALLTYVHYGRALTRFEELRAQGEDLISALTGAAFAACDAVLAGSSAGYALGLVETAPQHVTVALPDARHRGGRPGVVVMRGVLLGAECATARGFPVTSPSRTIADLADTDEPEVVVHHRLTRLLARMDGLRLGTVEEVADYCADRGAFAAADLVRQAAKDLAGSLSHSNTEARARAMVAEIADRFGLKVEPRPYTIFDARGVKIAEADIAIVVIKYDCEVDGPHHRRPAQMAKDQYRDRGVRRIGWEVDRYSTELIDLEPRRFNAQVQEQIRARLDAA